MIPLKVGAITVTTAATSIEFKAGMDIAEFVVDNRSASTLYVSYNGLRDDFRQVWPGDVARLVVRTDGVKSIWVYASAATTDGEVVIEAAPKPMYSG